MPVIRAVLARPTSSLLTATCRPFRQPKAWMQCAECGMRYARAVAILIQPTLYRVVSHAMQPRCAGG